MQSKWTEKDYNKMKASIKKGYEHHQETPEKALNFWWPVWQKINNYNQKQGYRHFYTDLDTWHGWEELPLPWMMDFEATLYAYGKPDQKTAYGEAMLYHYDYPNEGAARRIAVQLGKNYLEAGNFKKADAFYGKMFQEPGCDLLIYCDYAKSFIDHSRKTVNYDKAFQILSDAETRLKARKVNAVGSKEYYTLYAEVCEQLGMDEKAAACRSRLPQQKTEKKSFLKKLFKKKKEV